MLRGILLEEATPTGLIVHPFWVLVSVVNFLVLLYLLRRFLWGPIMATLAARADKIREGLDAAETAKREREQMRVEVERLLAEARQEAAAIAERTTKAAETSAVEIRAQAKAEADRIRDKGRVDAQQLHDQALAQLRGELASMVVLAAGRILGKEIGPEQHRALIERSLDEARLHLEHMRGEIETYRKAVRSVNRPKDPEAGSKRRGAGTSEGQPDKVLSVTVSIGAAQRTESLMTPTMVLHESDQALYRAKRAGRNRVSR